MLISLIIFHVNACLIETCVSLAAAPDPASTLGTFLSVFPTGKCEENCMARVVFPAGQSGAALGVFAHKLTMCFFTHFITPWHKAS